MTLSLSTLRRLANSFLLISSRCKSHSVFKSSVLSIPSKFSVCHLSCKGTLHQTRPSPLHTTKGYDWSSISRTSDTYNSTYVCWQREAKRQGQICQIAPLKLENNIPSLIAGLPESLSFRLCNLHMHTFAEYWYLRTVRHSAW